MTKHLICKSIPSDDFATGMWPVSGAKKIERKNMEINLFLNNALTS